MSHPVANDREFRPSSLVHMGRLWEDSRSAVLLSPLLVIRLTMRVGFSATRWGPVLRPGGRLTRPQLPLPRITHCRSWCFSDSSRLGGKLHEHVKVDPSRVQLEQADLGQCQRGLGSRLDSSKRRSLRKCNANTF